MSTKKKPGRPKGAKTAPTVHALAQPSRCPRCGSSKRSEYYNRREVAFSGVFQEQPYNRVVYRRCKCTDCGQHRIDRTYELQTVPASKPAARPKVAPTPKPLTE
jgi:hypothetical protein